MQELIDMLKITGQMLQKTHQCLLKEDRDLLNEVLKLENTVNDYEKKIIGILINLSKKGIEDKKTNILFQITRDIERIGDHCEDLVQRIEIKIDEVLKFSPPAQDELIQLFNSVITVITDTTNLCEKNDKTLLKIISTNKKAIDEMVEIFLVHHFDRLKQGICDPRSGMIFSDLVGILGGITKHSLAIAENWQ